MSKTLISILAVIILAGGFVLYRFKANQPAIESEVGGSVSPYDFNANGCVGDEGDLTALQGFCPAQGTCNVLGETDAIQAALKFGEASNQFPCGE